MLCSVVVCCGLTRCKVVSCSVVCCGVLWSAVVGDVLWCDVLCGHEATDTGLAYAPVSQAHGHNHIVQCFSRCCTVRGGGGEYVVVT